MGLPRIVPKDGAVIAGIKVQAGVWTLHRSHLYYAVVTNSVVDCCERPCLVRSPRSIHFPRTRCLQA
jgi:hypothetical protein